MTSTRLDPGGVAEVLKQRGLDGWLLFDFRGVNPIARRLIGYEGMVTRRVFAWLPALGAPQLVVHTIDRNAMVDFPGEISTYTTWQELHQRVGALIRGRRVAMEVSAEDAVPYVDRVPVGVVELLERLGAKIVSSSALVSQFAARLSDAEVTEHRQVAEMIAEIARKTLGRVVGEVGRATEVAVQHDVLAAFRTAGIETEDPPIVAFGAHAADPHYAPHPDSDATLQEHDVVLLDLWAHRRVDAVWADQTWMACAGVPSPEVERVWDAVRAARDAVLERLRVAAGKRATPTGAELDAAARAVVTERGYGEYFGHRTGHSIDGELHGSGPHLDDFETHDVREILPGLAFSVEPGVYLPGRFGVRSEINVVMGEDAPLVTPAELQTTLIRP